MLATGALMEGSPTMSPDVTAPRWVVVTRPDRPGLLDELAWRYRLAPWVEMVADRRRGEQRKRQVLGGADRRLGDRRGVPGDRTQTPAYRLVREGDGFSVYEATGFAPARCPDCGATVMFEMPKSGEPPARLDLHVVHDRLPVEPQHRARHIVELLMYTASGRPLLASRSFARTRVEVP
jgi:hypothetical protein